MFVNESLPGATRKAAVNYGQAISACNCSYAGFDENAEAMYYDNAKCPLDELFRIIPSPRWKAIKVKWSGRCGSNSIASFLSVPNPNPMIRDLCRRRIPRTGDLLHHFDGARVNLSASATTIHKVVQKFKGVEINNEPVTSYSKLTDDVFKVCMTKHLFDYRVGHSGLYCDLSPETIDKNCWRSSAGSGFDPSKIGMSGNKGMNRNIVMARVKWGLKKLFDGEELWDFMYPWAYVAALKAEVRGPDEEDKVRVLFQHNAEIDKYCELLYRPIMEHMRGCYWFMPGTSIFSTFVPKMLIAMRHPYGRSYLKKIGIVMPPSWWLSSSAMVIFLDITAQDQSYTYDGGLFLQITKFLMYDWSTDTAGVFRKISDYVLSFSNAKMIQLFGATGKWSRAFGVVVIKILLSKLLLMGSSILIVLLLGLS